MGTRLHTDKLPILPPHQVNIIPANKLHTHLARCIKDTRAIHTEGATLSIGEAITRRPIVDFRGRVANLTAIHRLRDSVLGVVTLPVCNGQVVAVGVGEAALPFQFRSQSRHFP